MNNKSVKQHFNELKRITKKLNEADAYESKHNPKYNHPGNDIEQYAEFMNFIIKKLETLSHSHE